MRRLRASTVAAALALTLAAGAAGAARGAQGEEAAAEGPKFEAYQLVLLKRPAAAPELPPERIAEIQRAHLAHMERQWHEGRLLVAGPFGDQVEPTLRGLVLYKVADVEEARRLASADPAVVAGRLEVEVVTWYVEEGYLAFPRSPPAPPAAPAAGEGATAPAPDGR